MRQAEHRRQTAKPPQCPVSGGLPPAVSSVEPTQAAPRILHVPKCTCSLLSCSFETTASVTSRAVFFLTCQVVPRALRSSRLAQSLQSEFYIKWWLGLTLEDGRRVPVGMWPRRHSPTQHGVRPGHFNSDHRRNRGYQEEYILIHYLTSSKMNRNYSIPGPTRRKTTKVSWVTQLSLA